MKIREEMLVYGKAYIQGRTYFLLNEHPSRPEKLWKFGYNVEWLAACYQDGDMQNVGDGDNPNFKQVYSAVRLVFGEGTPVEMYASPERTILVDVEIVDEEVAVSPI